MNLIDLIQRQAVPIPWAEGEKIPWNEPAFSRRMLHEHLSQSHEAASRRLSTIDAHVAWIHRAVLSGQPSKILDLGCGPGLYSQRLAQLGHTCRGIDFSPASIAYAREQAQAAQLSCTYLEQDLRRADYGAGYDLVMFIFGEFNVFRPAEIRAMLAKAYQALGERGRLLLEVHTFAAVQESGEQPASWYSAQSGLFADYPHLCLTESFWDKEQAVATIRYFIVEGTSGAVTRYASSMQAYTKAQYQGLLNACGFEQVTFYPSLRGEVDETQAAFEVIVAGKS